MLQRHDTRDTTLFLMDTQGFNDAASPVPPQDELMFLAFCVLFSAVLVVKLGPTLEKEWLHRL